MGVGFLVTEVVVTEVWVADVLVAEPVAEILVAVLVSIVTCVILIIPCQHMTCYQTMILLVQHQLLIGIPVNPKLLDLQHLPHKRLMRLIPLKIYLPSLMIPSLQQNIMYGQPERKLIYPILIPQMYIPNLQLNVIQLFQ